MARFEVVIKDGGRTLALISGRVELDLAKTLTDKDVRHIIDIEKFLEKLTGYRFHINQVS